MSIPHEARDNLICAFEGYLKRLNDGTDRVVPYLDPVGIPTIGYGSIWRRDGSRVAMSDPPISHEEAYALMDLELSMKCEPAVDRLIVPALHPLSRGALVSFTYNLGSGALKASTLRKVINERRWAEVPGEFAKWRMAGGRVLAGLVRRRKAEADMFMRGVALQKQGIADNGIGDWTTILARAA